MKCSACSAIIFHPRWARWSGQKPLCLDCDSWEGEPAVCDFCGAGLAEPREAPTKWVQEEDGRWHIGLACPSCAEGEFPEPEMGKGNNPEALVALYVPLDRYIRLLCELQWLELTEYTPEAFSAALAEKVIHIEFATPREIKYYDHAAFGEFSLYPRDIRECEGLRGFVYVTASGRNIWWVPAPDYNLMHCDLRVAARVVRDVREDYLLPVLEPPRRGHGARWNMHPSSLLPDVGVVVADIGRDSIFFRYDLTEKMLDLDLGQAYFELAYEGGGVSLPHCLWFAYTQHIRWVDRPLEDPAARAARLEA